MSIDFDNSHLLDELVSASHQIGKDPSLVLQGGGNASVKVQWRDVTGAIIPAIVVSGSGCGLGTITPEGFAPMRLERLRELLPPTKLADTNLANELRCALLDSRAPNPSVETLVHVAFPHAAVLHSHADSILTITNTPRGAHVVQEIWGDRILVVDYAMPGPDLAAACFLAWQAAEEQHDAIEGIIVLNHGLFTFADTPSEAWALHEQIIGEATQFLEERSSRSEKSVAGTAEHSIDYIAIAELRHKISRGFGRSMVIRHSKSQQVVDFLARSDLLTAAQRGPLTPDHVIWTGRVPMLGLDLGAFEAEYDQYFAEHSKARDVAPQSLPGVPKVVLDNSLGMLSVGRDGAEARATEQIYEHTMRAIATAEQLGGYAPASSDHIFDLEYWAPQQDKLRQRDSQHLSLSGQVALVTGAASGIGRACAAELLATGASVIGWDTSSGIADAFDGPNWLGLQVDVTDSSATAAAIVEGVKKFGGLDILTVAAGIFPQAQFLDELDPVVWRKTMAVNVDSVAVLYGLCHPLLKESLDGGRVIVIASKNVAAPGPGASAYSASKAALTQLSRVAALEWASDGIRVNVLHPDAVFDTALWSAELLGTRAEHYGITVDQYKRRNLLSIEVTSKSVGILAATMASETFSRTTGAQIPIDGGNERVI